MPQKRIVTMTGGSGGAIVLEGLRNRDVSLTAICTTFDDGGSTGRILKEFGNVLPAGDLRRCLWALASPGFARELFMHRLDGNGTELSDHSVGNILLLAAQRMCSDPVAAIQEVSKMLRVQGEVFPVSIDRARLIARLSDGSDVAGEDAIGTRTQHNLDDSRCIEWVCLDSDAYVLRQAAEALRGADLIVVGPGDFYTSIVPNFLPNGVSDAIQDSGAKFVLVTNIMTRAAETRGYDATDFAEKLLEYVPGRDFFDAVLVNNAAIPEDLARKYYDSERAQPVDPRVDDVRWEGLTRKVVYANLLSSQGVKLGVLRHDPDTLAQSIMGCV